MRGNELLNKLENIDPAYIEAAGQDSKKKKNNIWVKWGAIAACLAVIVSVSTLIYPAHFFGGGEMNSTSNNTQETINSNPIANNGKHSILSIPGAIIIEGDNYFVTDGSRVDIGTPDEYVNTINKYYSAVIGKADNIKTVVIPDGDFFWGITTFDIEVVDAVRFSDASNTVRCITMYRYTSDGGLAVKCGVNRVTEEIMTKPQGLFVFESASECQTPYAFELTVSSIKDLKLSDYADYYVGARYDCTAESFIYYGYPIDLNDIRNN